MKTPNEKSSGFTLVEVMVGIVLLLLVGGISYSILNSSTLLLAKNVSLNSTNTSVRSALDRIFYEVTQANGLPKLINASGATVSGSGPAAGVVFDRYGGGPYLVTNPGSTGLPASTTSVELKMATATLAASAIPKANDVIRIGSGTARPLVASCSPSVMAGIPPAVQTLTVTLRAALGQSIDWTSSVQETAFLVHRQAIVVVPVGTRNELRLYPDVETTSSTCDLTTSYRVLSTDIGTSSGDNVPFTVVTQSGQSFIDIAMRVEDQHYDNALAIRQAKEFNTFLQVNARVRPRNFL